jgi:hypothetical protein
MQYLVIVEKGATSFGAYVPDLLGMYRRRRITRRGDCTYS